MIGSLIIKKCLLSGEVEHVLSLVRKPSGYNNSKLTEIIVNDFEDYECISGAFSDIDAAFFCIGAYTGNVPDEELKKITVDYAVAFAKTLKECSPDANLCLLSGDGADRTGKSKIVFARYKGIAEETIAQMGLKFYAFRPSYIYPVTKRKEPNFAYVIFRLLYPIIKMFGKKFSIKSTELAAAMFSTGLYGGDKEIFRNSDIKDIVEAKKH